MLLSRSSTDARVPRPVIVGAGLSGLAISRALSASGIGHVLIGDRPSDAPRLGESLNAEGSLEIVRQFPALARFFFNKAQIALFFDGHALSFDTLHYAAGRAMFSPLDYPASVQLLHVDRVGFDRALFEAAVGDDHCLFSEGRAAAVDYDPDADRIDAIELASGATIASSYVFDATNHTRFIARKLGVPYRQIGAARRVVFAHYRAGEAARPEAARLKPAPWLEATTLARLDMRRDAVDGLAWCIPLGDYVSVGISVDPETTGANPALMLDWVESAYALRGVDVRGAFVERGTPISLRYEHYTHARCHGRNWLLAGPSCCQIWFPAAAGVATGLIAARLAPDILRAPAQVAPLYQDYIDRVAASHDSLEWTVGGDPWSVGLAELQQISRSMIGGNIKRLTRYLRLQDMPAELAFGDALGRMFEDDRRLASPLRIDAAPPEAQATRLFGVSAPDPWSDTPIDVPVVTRPAGLGGPAAILGVVDMLSGQRSPDISAELLAEDVQVEIDQFRFRGIAQWNAWVGLLRNSPRVTDLRLVPGSLSESANTWVLIGQWQAAKGGRAIVSPQFSMVFTLAGDRVAAIRTQRADYTFVAGDSILPPAAFAALLGELVAAAQAPTTPQ